MQSLVAHNAEHLLGFCLDSITSTGDRVAVFGPAPDEHTTLILAREGLLYVDCGRHYDWSPRIDALNMVLSDGVKAVIYASPNYPTGTVFPHTKVEEIVEKYAEAGLIFDCRLTPHVDLNSIGPQTIAFGTTGRHGGIEVFACGKPIQGALESLPEGINKMAQLDVLVTPRTYPSKQVIAERLREHGFRVEKDAPSFLFVQKVGKSAEEISEELRELGYAPDFEPIHTWRGGVCVQLEEESA